LRVDDGGGERNTSTMIIGDDRTLAEKLAELVSIADGECQSNTDEDLLHAVAMRCLEGLMLRLDLDAIHADLGHIAVYSGMSAGYGETFEEALLDLAGREGLD
jgi:hypothetical protein